MIKKGLRPGDTSSRTSGANKWLATKKSQPPIRLQDRQHEKVYSSSSFSQSSCKRNIHSRTPHQKEATSFMKMDVYRCSHSTLLHPCNSMFKSRSPSFALFILSVSPLLFTIMMTHDVVTKCEEGTEGGDEGKGNEIDEEEYDEEEERSCPFCKFFLDSPCKDTFVEWQKCVKVSKQKVKFFFVCLILIVFYIIC